MNAVYGVANPQTLTDNHGNVLPDVYLLPDGSTVNELASVIHGDLAKGLLYAIDARTGLHLPVDYVVRDRDVLSLVSTAHKGR
jgi:ribosome-binding ATPase YchF (GTP1/OBG family)